MRYYLLVSLLCSFSVISYTQSNMDPDYIVKNNGDTVIGYIDDSNPSQLFTLCCFKVNPKEPDNIYRPDDLSEFKFDNGKYFVSKLLIVEGKDMKVFCEFLINGKADLYYAEIDHKEHYYIQNEGDSLIELYSTEVDRYLEGGYGPYVFERKEYIGLLKTVFNDCPEIFPDVESSDLTPKRLMHLTEDYHKYVCKEYECINYRKAVNPVYYLNTCLGINNTMFQFSPKDATYSFLEDEIFIYESSLSIGVTISGEKLINISDVTSLRTGLFFQNTQIRSENYGVSINRFSIPLLYNFTPIKGLASPFFSFGGGYTYWFGCNSTIIPDYNPAYPGYLEVRNDLMNQAFGKHQFSLLGNIGCTVNINQEWGFFIYYQYEIGPFIEDNSNQGWKLNTTSRSNNFLFGIRYKIK